MSEFNQVQCFGVLDRQGRPEELMLNGKSLKVINMLKRWVEITQREKIFYCLQMECGRIMEVYYDLAAGEWWTYKVHEESKDGV